MLTLLAKLLKALNSGGSPAQLSWGFTLGMVVGLTPLWSLSNLLIFLIVSILRINFTAFLLAFILFSGIAYLIDPVMESLGYSLLTAPALQSFWTTLYASDIARLFHFNNTLVLGAVITGSIAAFPFFFTVKFLVKKYRQHLLAWVAKMRLIKFIKASKFYQIYSKLSGGALA